MSPLIRYDRCLILIRLHLLYCANPDSCMLNKLILIVNIIPLPDYFQRCNFYGFHPNSRFLARSFQCLCNLKSYPITWEALIYKSGRLILSCPWLRTSQILLKIILSSISSILFYTSFLQKYTYFCNTPKIARIYMSARQYVGTILDAPPHGDTGLWIFWYLLLPWLSSNLIYVFRDIWCKNLGSITQFWFAL